MMGGHLTMDKWDTFTVMLKDYQLQEFLNKIYLNKDLIEDKQKDMKQTIFETAKEWIKNNPFE